MTIEYSFRKLYSYTLFNYIGATTHTTPIRQALPQPAPSDANAIWLAPNGNDANPGTSALPVLTLAVAISLLTVTKTTIHIVRNGVGGALSFAMSGFLTLPASRNLQCELGEFATLFTAATGDRLTLSPNTKTSGISFEERSGVLASEMVRTTDAGSAPADTIFIYNCSFIRVVSETVISNNLLRLDLSANIIYSLTDCLFTGLDLLHITLDSVAGGFVMDNLAFIRPVSFVDLTGNTERAIRVNFSDTLGGRDATFVWGNFIFYGFDNVIDVRSGAALEVNQQTIALRGVDISQCRNFVNSFGTAGVFYAKFTLATSRPGYITPWTHIIQSGMDATITIVDTGTNLPGSIPPLYINELNGSEGDVEGFQLQRIGKTIGSGTYPINSSLIDAGPGSPGTDDIGPWDEEATLASQDWTEEFTIEFQAAGYSLSRVRQNPTDIIDVNGNNHTDDDGLKRIFKLDFGTGTDFASNNDMRKLINALKDKGALKLLPTDGGNLVTDSTSASTVDNGDGTMTVTPIFASGNPMIASNWEGFWANVRNKYYYILSNDDTTLTIVDKLGVGFPGDGVQDFYIDHILVKTNQNEITGAQLKFTNFICGGAFREPADDDTNYLELQGFSISLIEVEDPEEAT